MNLQRLILVSPLFLLLSCSGENGVHSKKSDLSQTTETKESKEDRVSTCATPDIDDEDLFDCFNSVEKVLQHWNAAIDEHRPEKLKKLYADQLMCYTNYKRNEVAVEEKTSWLNQRPLYRQELKSVEVYYNEQDTTHNEFAAEFTKVCKNGSKTSEVKSWLYFRKIAGSWKIVKETDAMTEVQKANKSKNGNLKLGKNRFYRGYWTDTRKDENFAHDEVPYRYAFELEVGAKVTGSFWNYSGRTRTTTEYKVLSGTIVNGILELKVAFNDEDLSDEDYNLETAETWRFRIVSENEIVGLDKDNPFTYGVSFPRTE